MIEPLQFRMYLCTFNMNIYIYIWLYTVCMRPEGGMGLLFRQQLLLLKWNEFVLWGLPDSAMHYVCEGGGLLQTFFFPFFGIFVVFFCFCFCFFVVEIQQLACRPWHNQFPALMEGKKSQTEVNFIPLLHDEECRPPHQVCITPLICIRVSLTRQRLPSLSSWEHTLHLCIPTASLALLIFNSQLKQLSWANFVCL